MGSIPTPGANARIGSAEIGLNVQNSNPPTAAYVGKDDSLWIMCANNAGVVVTVNARFLMPNGDIKLNQWTLVFSSLRAAQFKQIQLPECFLLSVAVVANLASAATNVSCFVAAVVSRLAPTAFNAAQTLCQGYTYGTQPVSWPSGVNYTSVDCAGVVHDVGGATPAAGANFSETVPSNAKWRIISMNFTLTTSATVANRGLVITLDDNPNVFATGANSNFVTAGQVATVCVSASPELNSSGLLVFPINLFGSMILTPGFRIRSAIQNLQVGDQISNLIYLVEEWLLP